VPYQTQGNSVDGANQFFVFMMLKE